MIGLLGGMSWESTKVYYELINQMVRTKKGDLHSANMLIRSVDFEPIASLQHDNQWSELSKQLKNEALRLEDAGATCIALATNTMHKVADDIEHALSVPLIHIADAVGWRITELGYKRVCLLGTYFTMTQPFYKDRLIHKFGLKIHTPNDLDRKIVHRIIYDELVQGVFQSASARVLQRIVQEHKRNGDDAVILGCTELPMLLKQVDSALPILDTTLIHAQSLLPYA